ncbi:DUF4214 domain-containing protein [Sulfurimonas sp. NW9]|uniref:DUF4214 domain-containing protein n=1 Tax=Sulfurimonas sp. NW9 TaxID=2922728 RepID=UPI003DA7B41B
MATIKEQLTQLYIAYFNRAPDADGLTYWLDQMQNTGMDYDAIAQNWSTEQQEFTDLYGDNLTNDEFVAKVYEHVLGRAPDADGLAYWSSELSSGTLNTGNLVQAVVAGASAPTGSLTDALTLTNRTDAGLTLANAGINNIDLAKKVVLAVNHKPETVSIAKSVISIAAKEVEQAGGEDAADLSGAITTLDTVHTMLTDTTQATTLDNTLANLETLLQKTEEAVVAGTVTDVASVLAATATTVEAASVDPTFVENPDTLATSLVENPDSVVTEATTTIEDANNPTPTPTPPPPPPADTTPPTMLSAVVNSDGDVVITYSESVASSTVEAGDYAVSIDGTPTTPTAATVSANTVTLTMPTKILASSTVTNVVYTAANGTANSIKDASGNAAIDQTLATVTNNSIWYTIAELTAATPTPTTYAVLDTAANAAADASTGTYITGNINVTLTDAATIAQLTTIDAATSGTLTYTAITDTAANLATNTGGYLTGAVNATVTDAGSVAAADLNTIDAATTGTVDASAITTLTGTAADIGTVLTAAGNGQITLNGNENITLTDANNTPISAADLAAIQGATGGTVTITNAVIVNGTTDGTSTADTIDVRGIIFTSSAVTINGNDGDDKIIGGDEADTINGGTGNDIIRGGAGVDTINGGEGDDTFVILGAIGAGDYAASDVTAGTGAAALGLADVIDAGVATSDSGTDGTGETYDGGTGTNTIEIWGNADITGATVSNIQTINTHSTLTIRDAQLQTLATNGAVTLDLLDTDSVITIEGSDTVTVGGTPYDVIDPEMGLAFLTYFSPAMSATDATNAPTFGATIRFNLDLFETGNSYTTYTIKASDVIPVVNTTNGTVTYTDATGENSVVYAADLSAAGVTATTINSDDGDDIIFVQNMDSSVTIDGGTDSSTIPPSSTIPTGDVLVYDDTNGATDDLDNVTNVEIVSFLDSGASVVATDNLVAAGAMLTVNAVLIDNTTATGLTWDGSAETDGSFLIIGSQYADNIKGGAQTDRIYADENDVIDGGADTGAISPYDQDFGDIVVFEVPVNAISTELTDADLQNIEVINVTDIGADATDTYDFSVQSEVAGFSIHVLAGVDATTGNSITSGVTIKGSQGTDYIVAGAGADTISGEGGDDTLIFSANQNVNTVTLGTGADTVILGSAAAKDDGTDEVNISDFVVGTDKLVLTGAAAGTSLDLSSVSVASDVYSFDANFKTTLTGNTATDMTTSVQLGSSTVAYDLAAGSTVVAGSLNDNITAATRNGVNTVNLGAGNDIFTGGTGGDTITGGAGDDVITLGTGADNVTVDAGTDTLINLAAADTLTVDASAIANLTSANGNTLDMTGLAGYTNNGTVVLNNTGGASATIKGGVGVEQITAGANGDTITGGAGDDVITLGTGADNVTVDAGTDTLINLAAADTLTVDASAIANLTSANGNTLDMTGLAGYTNNGTVVLNNTGGASATIKGGVGVEQITAGANGDTITGGAGDDTITLGAGADNVTVDAGTDTLINLAAADTLTVDASAIANLTSANGNTLDMTGLAGYTNNGTVVLNNTGGASATIKGGVGVEQITAGANGDTITGGAGDDTITLGAGADTVVFGATATANGSDTISSFTSGTDKLNVAAFETAGATVALTGNITITNGVVYTLVGQAAGAADSAAAAITAMDAAATITDTANTAWILISDDNSSAIYEWTGDAGSDGAANDTLTLVGTIDSTTVAGDLAI